MTPRLISVGDLVPDAELLDEGGKLVRLSGLWARRPVALFFLRHLG